MTISFDGHNLASLFMVGDPEMTILNSEPTTADAGAIDGTKVTGSRFAAGTVAMTLAVFGTASERRSAFSTLGAWLDVDEPKKLVLPDNGWYWMAIPQGGLDIQRGVDGDMAQLTFLITDPAAYGTQRTVTVPSGGSVTFTVDGTYPTFPVIAATGAVRNSESLLWGLRLDGGDFLHIATGLSTGRYVDIDCGSRVSTVSANHTPRLVTLDSDWFVLEPGEHTIENDQGTHTSCTVKYRERWL